MLPLGHGADCGAVRKGWRPNIPALKVHLGGAGIIITLPRTNSALSLLRRRDQVILDFDWRQRRMRRARLRRGYLC